MFFCLEIFDEDLHMTQAGGEGQVIRNADDLKEEESWSTMRATCMDPRTPRTWFASAKCSF